MAGVNRFGDSLNYHTGLGQHLDHAAGFLSQLQQLAEGSVNAGTNKPADDDGGAVFFPGAGPGNVPLPVIDNTPPTEEELELEQLIDDAIDGTKTFDVEGETVKIDLNDADFTDEEIEFFASYDFTQDVADLPTTITGNGGAFATLKKELVSAFGETDGQAAFNKFMGLEELVGSHSGAVGRYTIAQSVLAFGLVSSEGPSAFDTNRAAALPAALFSELETDAAHRRLDVSDKDRFVRVREREDDTVPYSYDVTAAGSDFTISIHFYKAPFTKEQMKVVLAVAKKLSQTIIGDRPEFVSRYSSAMIDDFEILMAPSDEGMHFHKSPAVTRIIETNSVDRTPSVAMVRVNWELFQKDNPNFNMKQALVGTVIHEFGHAVGIGPTQAKSGKAPRFADFIEGDPARDEKVYYTGLEGREAFAKTHGLTVVPDKIPLMNKGVDDIHLPGTAPDVMNRGPYDSHIGNKDYTEVSKGMMRDSGLVTSEPRYDLMVTLPGKNAHWGLNHKLTSRNGQFSAHLGYGGQLIIWDNANQKTHKTIGIGSETHNAKELVLTPNGNLVMVEKNSGLLEIGSHDENRWATHRSGGADDRQYMVRLTNDGALEIVQLSHPELDAELFYYEGLTAKQVVWSSDKGARVLDGDAVANMIDTKDSIYDDL